MALLIRTALSADQIVPRLRREIREVSPDLSTANIRMLDEIVSESMGSSPFRALVVSAFGATALLLAAVGVFGVFASGVASRIREIGIRMAIGATPGDIARLFLKEAAGPIVFGVSAGAVSALALGRLVRSLLFGVAATDPGSFAGAIVLLVTVALTASYLPVRRVLRMGPAKALRF